MKFLNDPLVYTPINMPAKIETPKVIEQVKIYNGIMNLSLL